MKGSARICAWLFALALLAGFAGPIASVFFEINTSAVEEMLTASSFPKVMAATLVPGCGGALLSVALGLSCAWPFARWEWRGKRACRLAFLLPYLVPNFVLATAYVIAWNPATGLLQRFLPFPGGLYGLGGMAWLFGLSHAPVAFLLFEDRLARMEPALHEQARLCGAGVLRRALRIDLPLLAPTLAAGFGLSFALNLSAFAIPAWIGAPERLYPLTVKAYQAMQIGGAEGLPLAAAYGALLFALALPLLVLARVARGREARTADAGRRAEGARPKRRALALFLTLFAAFMGLVVLAPLTCLALSTLTAPGCLQGEGGGVSCLAEPSLRAYRYVLFELEEGRVALVGSLFYGGIAAALTVLVSILTLAILPRSGWAQRLLETAFVLLTATPGAVIAVGLIVSATGRFSLNLYNTPWILVAAYVLKHQNLAFQPLNAGFGALPPSFGEAARLAGAGPVRAFTRISWPLLRADAVGGAFLAFVPILGELTMSVFLASPSFRPIGAVAFDLQDYADQAAAGALSILLVALVLAANELVRFFTRGRFGY